MIIMNNKNKRKDTYYYLLLIISLAIFIRLLPLFILREPLSTDVWPLIRETNIIVSNSNVRIWNNSALGGYNNRIPGVLLFASVVSKATGISPFYVYSVINSLIIGESMLLFYLFIKKLGGNGLISISFTFFSGPFLIFTSSLLKEVFAYPFFFAILLLSYFAKNIKDLILISLTSITLVITHPLPTIFLVSTLLLIPILKFSIKYIYGNRKELLLKYRNNDKFLLITSLILALSFLIYYISYGVYGVKGYLVNSITPTFSFYIILIVFTYIFFMPKYHIYFKSYYYFLLIFLGLSILYISTFNFIVLSNKKYDWQIALIGLPLILLIPLWTEFEFFKPKDHLVVSSLFLVFTSSFLYAIISNTALQLISYRFVNYIIIGGGIVSGLLFNTIPKRRSLIFSEIILSIITGILTISIISTNLLYSLHWYLSSQWRYSYGFVNSAFTVYKLNTGNFPLYGDVKVAYLFNSLTNINMILSGNMHGLLILYKENFELGFYTPINVYNLNILPINLNSDVVMRSPYIYVIYYR
ncbi:hypothetical protein Calag_0938 [Caldisphaera lagunensis DSM 15908]|uniref:Glycosyltransferase RgtA/B/C/D-like domain-containing protein n=2 Tax=Caldisphaera lagunensis TaxID=200415 RepID=L0AB74_CALLD|nr:hypothetical protein Calag_0938 [Caldisphaera lagunensis DSM 15908]